MQRALKNLPLKVLLATEGTASSEAASEGAQNTMFYYATEGIRGMENTKGVLINATSLVQISHRKLSRIFSALLRFSGNRKFQRG